MASEGYNGWTNELTWRVALVIDNDEGYYRIVRDWVAECAESGMSRRDARIVVADMIRDMVESEFDEALDVAYDKASPLVLEMIHAIHPSEINYDEIADGHLGDYTTVKSSNAKSVKSQNAKRKPAVSKAAKPKAASGKRPAQSKADPKKAGTARRR